MVFYSSKYYDLIGFEISNNRNKKYNCVLENKLTKKRVRVPFGDRNYQQYFDKLKVYSTLNHLDEKRRTNYLNRHKKDNNTAYSASWFSRKYLWGDDLL